jgi:hypothetical protein
LCISLLVQEANDLSFQSGSVRVEPALSVLLVAEDFIQYRLPMVP